MTVAHTTVLVIEDDPQIQRFLAAALESHAYAAEFAATGAEGLRLAALHQPEIVIVDLGLPDIPGLDVIVRLREWTARPILVLSARSQEADKVAALDRGADDYLTKPFGVPELLARLRVALRHASDAGTGAETAAWQWTVDDGDGLRLDASRRIVHRIVGGQDHEVRLTPTEFRLLLCLARHHGKVLTHSHLLREVWGPSHDHDVAYLRVYMGQLRQKLEREPARPHLLLTEPGVGYRMAAADQA